jgi:hypothetical protein
MPVATSETLEGYVFTLKLAGETGTHLTLFASFTTPYAQYLFLVFFGLW